MVEARPARLATTNVTDWKLEQKEDPVLYQVVKHLRALHEMFKAALHKVLDKKATAAYVKVKEQLLIKNGLLYRKTRQGQADEILYILFLYILLIQNIQLVHDMVILM